MTSSPAEELAADSAAELAASRQRRLDSRLSPPDAPKIKLHREIPQLPERLWDGRAAALFPGQQFATETGVWRVLGGPGTGKSSLLIDLAVAHIAAGGALDSVQFLVHSKPAAAQVRDELMSRIAQLGVRDAGTEPLVRSLHSYAFGLLARDNALRGGSDNAVALITGAEQDAVIRDLLRGHAEDEAAAAQWPEELRGALPLVGFAREVRDLLLRAVERGLSAADFAELGRQHKKPHWVAVAKFLQEYEQVQALAGSTKLSASELVSRAVDALRRNDELLSTERSRIQLLLVDDAEHLDPRSAELVALLADGVDRTIIAGDRDQTVLHFRGADESYLNKVGGDNDAGGMAGGGERDVLLRRSFRLPEALADVVACASAPLPGNPAERAPIGIGTAENPSAQVQLFTTQRAHYAAVADKLRRAHLEEDIAWSEMAVIVRSMAETQGLHRALLAYDVPVHLDPTDMVLAEQTIVSALLLLCDVVADLADNRPVPAHMWELVLTSRFVKADPVIMRRLRRSLRRYALRTGSDLTADDLIADIVTAPVLTVEHEDMLAELGPRETEAITHARGIVHAGLAAIPEGVESVLWAVWAAAGVDEELRTTSLRGGADGAQADRGLDAMMTLFDVAGEYVEDRPRASIRSFIQFMREQELPTGTRDRRGAKPEAVQLLSAHSALGQQWRVVVVAGVQEGTWPQLSVGGSLLEQQELVDLMDHDIDPNTYVSKVSAQMAEERRLFHVAVSRAQEKLLVTAVDTVENGGDEAPSRFIENLDLPVTRIGDDGVPTGLQTSEAGGDHPEPAIAPRVLSESALLTELRKSVADPALPLRQRQQAAMQLARLAKAGVFGADPDQWWGATGQSTTEPLWDETAENVRLSPSKVESLLSCPLKWMFGDVSSGIESTPNMLQGQLFHLLAEYREKGVPAEVLEAALLETLPLISDEPEWKQETTATAWLEAWQKWAKAAAAEKRELVGVEVPVNVQLGTTVDNVPVVLRGVIDRLTRERGDGTLFVTDLKTGTSAPSKDEAKEHPQLSSYQVAAALGTVRTDADGEPTLWTAPAEVLAEREDGATGDPETEQPLTAGADLVFPRVNVSLNRKAQDPFTVTTVHDWRDKILELAEHTRGPRTVAVLNPNCKFCDFRTSCPAQPTGKATTR